MNDLEVRLDESCRRLADGGFVQSYAIERDGGAGQATVGDRVLDEIVRQWGLSAGELDELSAEELDLYGGEQLLGCCADSRTAGRRDLRSRSGFGRSESPARRTPTALTFSVAPSDSSRVSSGALTGSC